MEKYSVIDLFAGAGGLSLGFVQSGAYDIKVAYENSPDMKKTYSLNHPNVDLRDDVCDADYHEIQKKYGPIDVIIGGPPCQGFSNANRQKSQAINHNNMLVKQFIRAILEIQPKAFIMENVGMLRSEIHRFYLSTYDISDVKKYHIPTKMTELKLLGKEFSFDGALEIIRNKELVDKYLWSEDRFQALNVVYKASKNPIKMGSTLSIHRKELEKLSSIQMNRNSNYYIDKIIIHAISSISDYYANRIDQKALLTNITAVVMVQRMLRKAKEIYDNSLIVDHFSDENGVSAYINSFSVLDYIKYILESADYSYSIKYDILCAADFGAPQKRKRFVMMGVKKTISHKIALPKPKYDKDEYRTVRDAIEDLEDIKPFYNVADDVGISLTTPKALSDLGRELRNTQTLKNHIITKSTKIALERFKALKQGENFHSLSDELKTNTYTDISRTQNTIYQKLNYDEPSGTVVNVRKSMWIHPVMDRAISVREAARLQSFPDSFVFCGSKDKQYQQVGNAVPPIMAKAIADKLASLLNKGIK